MRFGGGIIAGLLVFLASHIVCAEDILIESRRPGNFKFLSQPIASECEELFLLHQTALRAPLSERASSASVLSDYLQEKGSTYGSYIASKLRGLEVDAYYVLNNLSRSRTGFSAWFPAAALENSSEIVFRQDGVWRGLEFHTISNLIRFVQSGGADIYKNYGLDTLIIRAHDEYTADRINDFETALSSILDVAQIRHLRIANDQYSHRDYQLNRWVRRPNATAMNLERFPVSKNLIENLETLVLEDVDFSNDALTAIGQFKKLRYFGSQRVDFSNFDFRAWSQLLSITELQIIDANLTTGQVASLTRGRKNLVKLDIARNYDVTGQVIKSLTELESMRHLELTFTSVRLDDAEGLRPLRKLEKLGILGETWLGPIRALTLKRKLELPDLKVY